MSVRDLFASEDLGDFEKELTVTVDLHDARMVKITPEKPKSHHETWRPWDRGLNALKMPNDVI